MGWAPVNRGPEGNRAGSEARPGVPNDRRGGMAVTLVALSAYFFVAVTLNLRVAPPRGTIHAALLVLDFSASAISHPAPEGVLVWSSEVVLLCS